MKRVIYYSLIFLWVLSSCTHDDKIKTPTIGTEEGEIGVVFSVSLPSQTTNSTYAMDDVAENHLETIDILAFRVNSDGSETFIYKAVGTAIESTSEINKKKFRATLIKKSYAQRFVLIANAHDEIEDLGTINDEGVKEEVLKRLILKNEGQWNAKSSTDYTPFPMWGESNPNVLTDATTQIDPNPIKLLRMAARIDVIIDREAKGNFKLQSVALFNRKTHGHIVPNTDSEYFDSSNRKAIKATIPDESGLSSDLTILGPTRYTSPTKADSAFVQEIYTFEAAAVDLDKASQATCIVVGGIYENDTSPSYYRLDFVNRNDAGDVLGYKDVLRNHLYKVNIIEISGRGYDNEEDAFNAKPMNMEVIIREWDQGDYGNIVFDGQYLLAVDPGQYDLYRQAQEDIPIKIFTDYPGGWTAVQEDNSNWLTITNPMSGAENTDCVLLFNVSENTTGAVRTTKIKITAGRLTYEVIINQSPENSFTLTVTDVNDVEVSELVFPSLSDLYYTPITQDLIVTWTPCEELCGIADYNVTSDPFLYDLSSDPMLRGSLNHPDGCETLTLHALPMSDEVIKADPFHERIKRLDFTVSNGSSYKMRSVFLRQTNYTVVPEGVQDSYVMDGSTYSFTVKSNASWIAEIGGTSPNIIITNSYPTSGDANIGGITYEFKMINDENSIGPTSADIIFKSPEGKFHDVVVKIVGISPTTAREVGEANCYMIESGGDAVSFPVSQANADGTPRLTSSTEFTLELLWTDSSYGLSPNGAVESYSFTGKGSDARIIVKSGASQGNAVIALKVGNTIKWSWHIWVVDYDPEGSKFKYKDYTFMDRNIGALSNSESSDKHFGLFYQFGRKDPFPGISGINKSNLFTTYNAAGSPIVFNTKSVSVSNNIENGIENPFTYYLGTSANSNDWSTIGTTGTSVKLWGSNGGKSAYDPCPYGWRVSLSSDTAAKNPFNLEYPAYEGNSWLTTGVYSSYIGFYPIGGYLKNSPTGYTINETSSGYVWSIHELGSNQARAVKIQGSGWIGNWITPNNYMNRGDGIYVRCIKDYVE